MRCTRGLGIMQMPDEEEIEDMLERLDEVRRSPREQDAELKATELREFRVDEEGVEGLMSEGTAPAGGGEEGRPRTRLERFGV
ncbi:hypothetical protein ONZ45_g13021 [Pleurotus djamor]|nr:hypothetical protein ONZ45_g13021 [Pleurotus djamor]